MRFHPSGGWKPDLLQPAGRDTPKAEMRGAAETSRLRLAEKNGDAQVK